MCKCMRFNEFVEILNHPCILNCCLKPLVKPALELRMLFHYKMQKQEKVKNNGQYKRKKKKKEMGRVASHEEQTHQAKGSPTNAAT